jgi:glycosyltransferase involved in cell wall biosynthesis
MLGGEARCATAGGAAPARIVMIYIEPTPYITALVEALRASWAGPIEAYYITTDLSQSWQLRIDEKKVRVLPTGFLASMRVIQAALIREREHTILHLAGWGHPVLLAAMFLARSVRIPVAVESDTAEGRSDRSWRSLLKKLLYPLLFRLPSRFLPAGSRQANYLAGFGVTPERMTIAQMTVDVGAIRRFCLTERETARSAARARWGLSADDRNVLYIGRLEDDKGLKQLLSAFARAVAEDNDLRLTIAGDGNLRSSVEAIAANPQSHVIYLGRLAGEDVLRAYLAADFMVLPSLFEPWGLVVNEAMACGLPVLVSDRVGCADDLVRHGETGLVVGAGRELELTSAICRLARDALARSRMGHAAEKLVSNWTLDNEARNIVATWGEIA